MKKHKFDAEYYYQNLFWHPFWTFIAEKLDLFDPYLFITSAIFLFIWRYRIFSVCFTYFLVHLTQCFLKLHYQRPRPFWVHPKIKNTKMWSTWAFPSGHAMSSMQFAISLLYVCENLQVYQKAVICLIPLSIGLSRVYLGLHSFLDISVGWIVGALITGTIHHFKVLEWFSELTLVQQCYAGLTLTLFVVMIYLKCRFANKHRNEASVVSKWDEMANKKNTSPKNLLDRKMGSIKPGNHMQIIICLILTSLLALSTPFQSVYRENQKLLDEFNTDHKILATLMLFLVMSGSSITRRISSFCSSFC